MTIRAFWSIPRLIVKSRQKRMLYLLRMKKNGYLMASRKKRPTSETSYIRTVMRIIAQEISSRHKKSQESNSCKTRDRKREGRTKVLVSRIGGKRLTEKIACITLDSTR